MEQLDHYEEKELETQGWREGARCECPVLPPGTMVRAQPKLPLKAKFGSMATQWQGSVSMPMVHFITRDHMRQLPGTTRLSSGFA